MHRDDRSNAIINDVIGKERRMDGDRVHGGVSRWMGVPSRHGFVTRPGPGPGPGPRNIADIF